MQLNIKLSYNLIPLILAGMTRPVQITKNSKFAKSLQYLKIEVRDEHQIFQYTDTILFDGCGQACLKYLKQQVCSVFVISQERIEL